MMITILFTNIIVILKHFLSFKSKNLFLANFFDDLDKFNKLKPQKEETIDKTKNEYDTVLELYNGLLETYFDEYFDLSDAKRSKIDPKYDSAILTLDEFHFSEWYKKIQLMERNQMIRHR